MAERTNTVKEALPAIGFKIVQAWTAAATSGDTTVIDLSDYGVTTVYNLLCQVHSTDNSVIVTESATTAVSSGELTVTFPSGNDGKKRSILIVGQ
jgi:hypothetical protein